MLAGLLITMGNLGDRFGRKRLLLFGGSLFALISVGAAYSANAEMLIVYRALLGVAGATLMPPPWPSCARRSTTRPNEARDRGGERHGCGPGAAAGPLFGGALLQYFWWGSVFLVNVPIMALVLLIGLPALRESKDPGTGQAGPARWCCRWSGSSVGLCDQGDGHPGL